jgi:cell division protein FtsZ
VYGVEKVKTFDRERASLRYIVLRPDQFDDDAIIEILEHNPAYNRDKKIADEVRNAARANATRVAAAAAAAATASQPATPAEPPATPPSASPNLDNLAAEANSKTINFL